MGSKPTTGREEFMPVPWCKALLVVEMQPDAASQGIDNYKQLEKFTADLGRSEQAIVEKFGRVKNAGFCLVWVKQRLRRFRMRRSMLRKEEGRLLCLFRRA